MTAKSIAIFTGCELSIPESWSAIRTAPPAVPAIPILLVRSTNLVSVNIVCIFRINEHLAAQFKNQYSTDSLASATNASIFPSAIRRATVLLIAATRSACPFLTAIAEPPSSSRKV